MKKALLLLPLLALSLCGCSQNSKSKTDQSTADPTKIDSSSNDGITTITLNLSNFERYISYTKYQGFTGVAGSSPYMAWIEFKGLLSIGVYDAVVTYVVGGTSYNFGLDVSGGGKTDYFDRNESCSITNVSGTLTYRL